MSRRRRRDGGGPPAKARETTIADVRPGDRVTFRLNGADRTVDVFGLALGLIGKTQVARIDSGRGGTVYASPSVPARIERGAVFIVEDHPVEEQP